VRRGGVLRGNDPHRRQHRKALDRRYLKKAITKRPRINLQHLSDPANREGNPACETDDLTGRRQSVWLWMLGAKTRRDDIPPARKENWGQRIS